MSNCTECNGTGIDLELLSNCCGATIPQYPDYDFCAECREHCEPSECEECNGKG